MIRHSLHKNRPAAARPQRVVAVDSRSTRFETTDEDGRRLRLTTAKLLELVRILGPRRFRERFSAVKVAPSWKRPPQRGAYVARAFFRDRPTYLWCEAGPDGSLPSAAVAHIVHLPGGGLEYVPHGRPVPKGHGIRADRVTSEVLGDEIEPTVALWLGRASKYRGKAPATASRAPLELPV